MKTTFLFLIIFGILVSISLFGGILIVHTSKAKLGKKILKKSAFLLFMLLIGYTYFASSTRPYSLYKNQKLWSEYGLPQIDAMMYLSNHRSTISFYNSTSTDSIRHTAKNTQYDLFDVYSIEDVFSNLKQKKTLRVRFIKPNILRDSSRLMTLESRFEYPETSMIDTLSISQFDSVLVAWELREKVYTKVLNYLD